MAQAKPITLRGAPSFVPNSSEKLFPLLETSATLFSRFVTPAASMIQNFVLDPKT